MRRTLVVLGAATAVCLCQSTGGVHPGKHNGRLTKGSLERPTWEAPVRPTSRSSQSPEQPRFVATEAPASAGSDGPNPKSQHGQCTSAAAGKHLGWDEQANTECRNV